MTHPDIPIRQLVLPPFTSLTGDGALLVVADAGGRANPMTIGWGMYGTMWGRPSILVMVRPTRFTWELMSEAPDFTVNWLPADLAPALHLCGTRSGRDMDKFSAAGITPVPGRHTHSPALAEAVLTVEGRIIYRDTVDPDGFVDPALDSLYAAHDYHATYIAEIVAAYGDLASLPHPRG